METETLRNKEGWFDAQMNWTSSSSKREAYKSAKLMLLQEAGRLFSEGKDSNANLVRSLAGKFDPFIEEASKTADEHKKIADGLELLR